MSFRKTVQKVKFKLNKRYLSYLKIAIPIALLIFIYFESKSVIKDFNFHLLKKHLDELNWHNSSIIIVAGILATAPMMFYDIVLGRILKLKMKYKDIVLYSITTNTYSNFIGFGGVAGLSLRTFFLKDYYRDRGQLIKNIAKVSVFYLAGLSVLSWLVSFDLFKTDFLSGLVWLRFAVWGLSLYIPFLLISFYISKKKKRDSLQFSSKHLLSLVVISIFEWLFASILFYIICHLLHLHISYKHLFPIFIVGACAGIISMIPGGLGSFDLVLIMGLEYYHHSSEKILLVLLLYRISYYLIPFLLGTVILFKHLWTKIGRQYQQIIHDLATTVSHWILTILVFSAGFILLVSAALPGVLDRLKFLKGFLSLPIMQLSLQLSITAGLLLILLSRGIEYKVKWAYHATIFVLILAGLLSLAKGLDYEEAIFLFFVAVMLWLSKKRFYRVNFVITWGKAAFDLTVILLFVIIYLAIGYANLPMTNVKIPTFFRQYMIYESEDLFRSAFIGLALALIVMLFVYVLRRPYSIRFQSSYTQVKEIKQHFEQYGGTVLSHLVFLHDKHVYWGQSRQVMFIFEKYADKLVVLGDPIGNEELFGKAFEEFQDFADRYGYTPVYYQVNGNLLPILHENGYDFFKLGEEGLVHLKEFSLFGKRMNNSRELNTQLKKSGYEFSLHQPPFSNGLLDQLREISDQWLQGKSEKGFSLGFFNEHYLNLSPLGLVRDRTGKVIAFASLMPKYDKNKTISVDLLRFSPDAPQEVTDFLLLQLFESTNKRGYEYFNLGMAPLANVGLSKYSFLGEKIASQIFTHGGYLNQFQGLKKFKEKYADGWEAKFLAYRKKTSLPITMIQISLLISKKRPNS
jgi:phosphatidylglycerol lysyltransferase